MAQLAQEIYANDILLYLSVNMSKFEFEARKDACQIFNNLLRRQIGSRSPTVEYLCTRDNVLVALMNGQVIQAVIYAFISLAIIFTTLFRYEQQDTALFSGMVLRECIRHEPLVHLLLFSPNQGQSSPRSAVATMEQAVEGQSLPFIYKLFDYVELPTFDIASDAFATLKVNS